MELWDRTIHLLNKPFPLQGSSFKIMALISVFITLFLYVFKPFDLNQMESHKFLICLGFGGTTFIASIVYDFIVVQLLRIKTEGIKFTFGRWIIFVIGLMLVISISNFLFARIAIFGTVRWEFLPQMIHGTFTVGILPTIVIGILALLRQERKYQIIAHEVGQNSRTFRLWQHLLTSFFMIFRQVRSNI